MSSTSLKPLYRAKVLFAFDASEDSNELSVPSQSIVEVLENNDPDWHLCQYRLRIGYVPATFLERIPELPPKRNHTARPAPPIPGSIIQASKQQRQKQAVNSTAEPGEAGTSSSKSATERDASSSSPVAIRIRQKKTDRPYSAPSSPVTKVRPLATGSPDQRSTSGAFIATSATTSPTARDDASTSGVSQTRSLWEQLQAKSEQQKQQEREREQQRLASDRRSGLAVLDMIKKRKEQQSALSGDMSKSFSHLPSNLPSANSNSEIPPPPSMFAFSRSSSSPSLSPSGSPSATGPSFTVTSPQGTTADSKDDSTGKPVLSQDHRGAVLKIREELERKGLVFGMPMGMGASLMGPRSTQPAQNAPSKRDQSPPLATAASGTATTSLAEPTAATKRSHRRSLFFSRLAWGSNKVTVATDPADKRASLPHPSSNSAPPSAHASPSHSPPQRVAVLPAKKISIPIRISNLNARQKELIRLLSDQLAVHLRRRRLRTFVQRDPSLADARIRKNLVDELYATEKSYYTSLETAVDVFLTPLRQKKVLKKRDVETIFGSIEQIKQTNFELLSQLEIEMKNDTPRVGRVIKSMSPFLRAYTNYVNQYDDANALFEKSLSKNRRFASFLEKQYTLPQCVGLDLPSFLIQPVQRIPRYRMLLSDIIKRTPEDHVDYKDLVSGLESIMGVATLVNERRRQAENSRMLQNLSPRLRDVISSFVQPHRRIVETTEAYLSYAGGDASQTSAEARVQNQPFLVFIFTDLVLFVTKADQGDIDVFPVYLAFSKVHASSDHLITLDTFYKGRRTAWQLNFSEPKDRQKYYDRIQEHLDRAYKSACSKLGEEFDLKLLQELETTRFELGSRLPEARAELVYHRTKRQTLTEKREKLEAELAVNKAKIEELMRLVEKQETELAETSAQENDSVEKERNTSEKVDVMVSTTEECDKLLMLVLNKETQAFEHIYNAKPVTERPSDLSSTTSSDGTSGDT